MTQISENILHEADFFAVSLLCGAFLILLYDILRVFRRLVRHGTIWTAIEDMLYWLVAAIVMFAMLYQKNDGLIRGFAIGGIALGMLLYNHFISRWAVRGIVWILKKIIAILSWPLRKLAQLLKKPLAGGGKILRRLWKKAKKLLKKVYKAVRMGLCKL